MVEITWSRTALKQLQRIDARYRKSIKDKVAELKGFPLVALDFKKLSGSENRFRLRVGTYRVIFDVEDGEPKILEIKEIKRRSTNTY
ncbi:type II toxin-antitoxin system RelE/ParE family toxin [Salmonella enterica]|nr:type II toxin-antitoxin system RelE/ParE family toxin [Salmonella enterica subsp. diarizonae]ECJ5865371.1 type II toxin-antitoxin system RelE/ParE family toxin [Salmonella enterica subsp. diarizonae]EEB6126595.1 type II toxin-antitoxin system RelE/ParE family toxin [Salmonella enterica subsp. diarizonae]MEI37384.1 type II toxin-antitoxin system RelE/ParE family toxin [Salmonella enterica]